VTRVLDKIGVAHRYQAIVLARDAGLADARGLSLPSQGLLSRRTGRFTCRAGTFASIQFDARCADFARARQFCPPIREGHRMPKFVIEREIAGVSKLRPQELKAISQKSCGVLQAMVRRSSGYRASSPTTRSTASMWLRTKRRCASTRRGAAFPPTRSRACTR